MRISHGKVVSINVDFQALFQIECGICTQCKLDCCKLVKCIRPLSIQKRKEYIAKVAPKLASRKRL